MSLTAIKCMIPKLHKVEQNTFVSKVRKIDTARGIQPTQNRAAACRNMSTRF